MSLERISKALARLERNGFLAEPREQADGRERQRRNREEWRADFEARERTRRELLHQQALELERRAKG